MISFDLIIPHFGSSEYLNRALASVLRQSLQPSSIIVVDDASPEPVRLPASQHVRDNVRIIRHERNLGAAAARTTGLKAASSDWVTFLDSDDILLTGSLEDRARLIEQDQQAKPRKDFAYACGWKEVDQAAVHVRSRVPMPSRIPGDFFTGCWFAPGSCLFLNRPFVLDNDCLPDAGLRLLEDFDWFARLGEHGLQLKVLPILGAQLEIRRDHDPILLSNMVARLRGKWSRHIDRKDYKHLDAYLSLEEAATAYAGGQMLDAFRHMARSLWLSPRFRRHLSPGWQGKPFDQTE